MPENTIDRATFDALKEMTGADFIGELVDTFFLEAPRLLTDLQQALASNDAELFRRSAHSLKSNSNTFGALALGNLAKELEFIGRDNQLASVGNKLDALNAEYEKAVAALKGLRDA